MPFPRTEKYKMLKQVLLWTMIIALITHAGYFLGYIGDARQKELYTWHAILWELYIAFAVSLGGVIHYHWIYLGYWVTGRKMSYALLACCLLVTWFLFCLSETMMVHYPRHLSFHKLLSRTYDISLEGLIIFYIPVIILYTSIHETRRNRERKRELEYEQRRTAILLLKIKLEPHFLFNTLNAIYAIAQKERAYKTITAIDDLSEQVRRRITAGDNTSNTLKSPIPGIGERSKPLIQFLYIWLGINGFMIFNGLISYINSSVSKQDLMRYWIYQPVLVMVVSLAIVTHFYWLYKPLFMQGRYKRYFLSLPVFIVVMILVDASVNGLFDLFHFFGDEEAGIRRLLQVAVWRVLIADGICAWVYAAASHYKTFRRQTMETEQATRENELRLLQSKTDTTALFNSLTTIHETVNSESAPETTTAVNELISLFRYSADKADKETVPVPEEMQFIEQYLHLQKMRVQQGEYMLIHSSLTWDGGPADIAPMLLLPYIENAFKYGISYEHPSEINIDISITNQTLNCHIANTDHSLLKKHISPGIGLADTAKRLQLQYEGKYQLEQKSENGIYTVYLRLDLR